MAYSEDDKAIALAALQSMNGNITAASKFTGIPASTIRHWRDGQGVNEAVTKNGDIKKKDLAELFEELARATVGSVTFDDITDASLTDRMKAAGIAVDKMQLLRNKPTAITDEYRELPDDELDRRIAALEAGKAPKARGRKPKRDVP